MGASIGKNVDGHTALDVRSFQKHVGILYVKVLRASKLKRPLLGTSDPYVKLKLTNDRAPSKNTTVLHKTLNPEWNEEFNIEVRDPQTQILEFVVHDWEKIGKHEKMGMNRVELKDLPLNEAKVMSIELVKTMDDNDPQNHKLRGQIELELTYKPFDEEEMKEGYGEANAVRNAPEGGGAAI